MVKFLLKMILILFQITVTLRNCKYSLQNSIIPFLNKKKKKKKITIYILFTININVSFILFNVILEIWLDSMICLV